MKSLKQTCESFVVHLLTRHLQMRKKMIGKWMVSFSEWVELMKLDSLKVWLCSLPVGTVQSIMETAMSQLKQARDRDLLLCILTISLNPRMTKFVLPQALAMDEASRLYVLDLLGQPASCDWLHTFCCPCYQEGRVRYMAEQVRFRDFI